MEADAVFLQFFHGEMPDPTEPIRRLKGLPAKPMIFTSLGDAYGRWARRVPKSFQIASALSDVTFLTGMGYLARKLAQSGSRNLVLMPHGCCQIRFACPVHVDQRPEFDVIFVGSRYRSRNPAAFWWARRRTRMVESFTTRYGRRFGLFGHGWDGNPSWQGPLPFDQQQVVCGKSATTLGGTPGGYHDYYLSDRPFIAAASGVPLVDYAVRGVEHILEPGVDWWLAKDIEEMIACCDHLIEMSFSERLALGIRARERTLTKHTQYHRCLEMVEIVHDLRSARLAGRSAKEPKLTFLAEVKTQETPPSIVGWQG
jgi:hypothetical protein